MRKVEGGIEISKAEMKSIIDRIAADPMSSTPIAISDEVRKFCRRLKGSPVYVSVVPEPNAPMSECFHVVERKIKRDGGKMEVGWLIWEWPTILIEAEHHAIWIDNDNQRWDISPKQHGERRVLFVPDSSTPFRPGKRTENKRKPLRADQRVRDFIGASQLLNSAMGMTTAPTPLNKDIMTLELYRINLILKLRDMTPRDAVEAARKAAQTSL